MNAKKQARKERSDERAKNYRSSEEQLEHLNHEGFRATKERAKLKRAIARKKG